MSLTYDFTLCFVAGKQLAIINTESKHLLPDAITSLAFQYFSYCELTNKSRVCRQWHRLIGLMDTMRLYKHITQKFQKELIPYIRTHHVDSEPEMNPSNRMILYSGRLDNLSHKTIRLSWESPINNFFSFSENDTSTSTIDFSIYGTLNYAAAYQHKGSKRLIDSFYYVPLVSVDFKINNPDLTNSIAMILTQAIQQINFLIANKRLNKN